MIFIHAQLCGKNLSCKNMVNPCTAVIALKTDYDKHLIVLIMLRQLCFVK
jgi:hypothetical protein